mgnify:CR=1 FL=1
MNNKENDEVANGLIKLYDRKHSKDQKYLIEKEEKKKKEPKVDE